MIHLTSFSGGQFYLNADIIQTVESTPDTVITLINNQKILVKNKAEEVVEKIIVYHRMVHNVEIPVRVGDV